MIKPKTFHDSDDMEKLEWKTRTVGVELETREEDARH